MDDGIASGISSAIKGHRGERNARASNPEVCQLQRYSRSHSDPTQFVLRLVYLPDLFPSLCHVESREKEGEGEDTGDERPDVRVFSPGGGKLAENYRRLFAFSGTRGLRGLPTFDAKKKNIFMNFFNMFII